MSTKHASIGKGLLAGLLGVGDFTPEILARQAGKGVRRAVMPVSVAGGTAAVMKSKKGEKHEEKTSSARDNLHLGLAGLGAVAGVGSAVGSMRAAKVRERMFEHQLKQEKRAYWAGFDKGAAVYKIPHGDGVPSVMDKLRKLVGKMDLAKANS